MTDVEKLLVRIETARDAISRKADQTSLDYMIDGVLMECSVLLKEQEVVVRCRDCKYYNSFTQQCLEWIDGIMIPDFYCANGERKEGR